MHKSTSVHIATAYCDNVTNKGEWPMHIATPLL